MTTEQILADLHKVLIEPFKQAQANIEELKNTLRWTEEKATRFESLLDTDKEKRESFRLRERKLMILLEAHELMDLEVERLQNLNDIYAAALAKIALGEAGAAEIAQKALSRKAWGDPEDDEMPVESPEPF